MQILSQQKSSDFLVMVRLIKIICHQNKQHALGILRMLYEGEKVTICMRKIPIGSRHLVIAFRATETTKSAWMRKRAEFHIDAPYLIALKT
jgi:hypothetical protein